MSKSVELSYSSLTESCKAVMNSRRYEKLVSGLLCKFPLGKKIRFFVHIFIEIPWKLSGA